MFLPVSCLGSDAGGALCRRIGVRATVAAEQRDNRGGIQCVIGNPARGTGILNTEQPARAVRSDPRGDSRLRKPVTLNHAIQRPMVLDAIIDPDLGHGPVLDEFRVFLERHAALLRALPAWTLRIVVPPQFPDIAQR